jgi:hypothetical protein
VLAPADGLQNICHDLESKINRAHDFLHHGDVLCHAQYAVGSAARRPQAIINTASLSTFLHTTDDPMLQTAVEKVTGRSSQQVLDCLAIEEPLEIQFNYGVA